jgi:hypothetical protein
MVRFMRRRWKWLLAAVVLVTMAGWTLAFSKLLAPHRYIDKDELNKITWEMTRSDVLAILGPPEEEEEWSSIGHTLFKYRGALKKEDEEWCRYTRGREPDRAYLQLVVHFNAEGTVCQKGQDGVEWEPTLLEKIQVWLREHVSKSF